jgi:hypothetical protein
MSRLTQVAAIVFAMACLSQPLALDACSVSCEAARAARGPVISPPCHHTTSCATQISQPTSAGAAVHAVVPAPPVLAMALDSPKPFRPAHPYYLARSFGSPPAPLRI